MVWAQKETVREVSRVARPMWDLNHWRASSTRLTRAMGASATWAANSASWSNTSSSGVSRTCSMRRVLRRASSLAGSGGSQRISFCISGAMSWPLSK